MGRDDLLGLRQPGIEELEELSFSIACMLGAGDGTRTRDNLLGRKKRLFVPGTFPNAPYPLRLTCLSKVEYSGLGGENKGSGVPGSNWRLQLGRLSCYRYTNPAMEKKCTSSESTRPCHWPDLSGTLFSGRWPGAGRRIDMRDRRKKFFGPEVMAQFGETEQVAVELFGVIAFVMRVHDNLVREGLTSKKTEAAMNQCIGHLQRCFEILTPNVPWNMIVPVAMGEHQEGIQDLSNKHDKRTMH